MSLTTATQAGSAATARGVATDVAHACIREFLAFKLGAEEYGIDILRVQEIRSYEGPTRIAIMTSPDMGLFEKTLH